MQEALDRLLDSLEVAAARRGTLWDDWAGESETVQTTNGSRAGIATLVDRARQSRRPVYRIPRLFVAWAVLVAGVCALIWVIFTLAGLK